MSQILLAIPYPLESPRGNSVSANRILGILEELGHTAIPISGRTLSEPEGDMLIALHARKSAVAIESFHAKHPDKPVTILLTGSDLYADLQGTAENRATMQRTLSLARFLVVSQQASIADIPEAFREKAHVVPKSLLRDVPQRINHSSSKASLEVILPTHLRPAKAPLLVLESLSLLPLEIDLQINHFGAAEDAKLGEAAQAASDMAGSRYHWYGNRPHEEVLDAFARADLLLNTSRVEGGANVLCEAIQMGLPCIATSIPPNVGMLGEDYPGLFPMDDAPALAALLERCSNDAHFLQTLTEATVSRAPLFTRNAEKQAWRALIDLSLEG